MRRRCRRRPPTPTGDSWGRVVAALVRLTRDVDIAEEATADAFMLALRTWPAEGVPHSMEAWLLTAARRRAIDRVRRAGRLRDRLDRIAAAYPNAVLADRCGRCRADHRR